MPENSLERLRATLDELFRFDQADLDFGLYRIMNVRRDEIRQFLQEDLLLRAREALGLLHEAQLAVLQAEIDKAAEQARELGIDPSDAPRVRELRAKLETEGESAADAADVYGHLASFFRRYYRDGDFISQRRYREGAYAIPYEGEEVKLHWANADQYYIKTTEVFREYTFLVPDTDGSERRVSFRLASADSDRTSRSSAAGHERRFVLAEQHPVDAAGDTLNVRFEYRPMGGKTQAVLNAETELTILAHPATNFWRATLERDVSRDGTTTPQSLLRKHVNTYTAKNSFDYFIHKDLGAFLRRELDYYLKNEVLSLDDVDVAVEPTGSLMRQVRKVQAIRAVGLPIISMLASLEEFQKRIWLKKKFVVDVHWCVTVDRLPRTLYRDVLANKNQREEWVRLFSIDSLDEDGDAIQYSAPLTEEFLEANPHLIVDTSLFDKSFCEQLLSSIDNLDESVDGVLIESDNFQALNLLQERYRGEVQCVYIDPPYNTELDRKQGNFLYRDSYENSSWLSMMEGRLSLMQPLLSIDASVVISIDDNEVHNLRHLGDLLFGTENFIGAIAWKSRDSVSSDHLISLNHNYHLAYAVSRRESQFGGFPIDESEYNNPDEDPRGPWKLVPIDANKPGGDTQYAIVNPVTGESHRPPNGRSWAFNSREYDRLLADGRIAFGKRGRSKPQKKLFLRERLERGDLNTPKSIWIDSETTKDGTDQIVDLFGRKAFSYPKPVGLLRDLVRIGHRSSDSLVMDCFAGSGTTAHAVIDLNRRDGGNRKYLLVEIGEYFETILRPRVLKAVYSDKWKKGKPTHGRGVSQLIKVVKLESYEDALNNLDVTRTDQQLELLERVDDRFRRQYALRYWISTESRGSSSLLDIGRFENPWSYVLKVGRANSPDAHSVKIDLVETFNYLLGLRIVNVHYLDHMTLIQGKRWPALGVTAPEEVLVIWRNTQELDSEALDAFLWNQPINPRDMTFDVVYVNGDNHLQNARGPNESWKVRLIEDEFQRLMFESAEIGERS